MRYPSSVLLCLLSIGCLDFGQSEHWPDLEEESPFCVFSCDEEWGDSGDDEDFDSGRADGRSAARSVSGARWASEVGARIADEEHAFIPVAGGYAAAVRHRGLAGVFQTDAATLLLESDEIRVRTVGVAREGRMEPVSFASPDLGMCAGDRWDAAGACVRRVEYVSESVTEWWSASEFGFEQGWTFADRPVGPGLLTVDVDVVGAQVVGANADRGAGLWILGDSGRDLMVTPPLALDADGQPLEAWFLHRDGGYTVAVDDTHARYPIEIDPVFTTAEIAIDGPSAASNFGYSVAAAGDVDNDGYDDVIVGAQRFSSYTGRAYVFHGSAAGLSSTATTTLVPTTTGTAFGVAVSGAGDVNDDGFDDVIVGADEYDSDNGQALVFHGSAAGVGTTAASTLIAPSANGLFGFAVDSAGDVNGDDYGDVIVGAYAYSSGTGRAYIHHGSASGVSGTASRTLTGGTTSNYFGRSVAGVGDVNNDGYGDVAIGAYGYLSSTGRVYVYHGSAAGIPATQTQTLTGASSSYNFGISVAGAGDVDFDTYDDIIVGANRYSSYRGQAYIFHGSSAGTEASATLTLTGAGTDDYFGYSVASAGDVNSDGFADVVVGAHNDASATGSAYIYEGSASGIQPSIATTLTGTVAASSFGLSVDGAGDVNSDGFADVLVGAYAADAATGQVSLFLGFAYVDSDGDGYADQSDDCDDTDPDINPAATEIVDDGIDQDCDGGDLCYVDADGDNFGTAVTTAGDSLDCDAGSGANNSSDCDDGDGGSFPGSAELESTIACMDDDDGDGFGDQVVTGGVVGGSDCADSSAAVYPGASETPGDSTDQDCDGVDSCYTDDDGDNYGTSVVIDGSSLNCVSGTGAPTADDCNDGDADLNPAEIETVDDGIDQDCDGVDSCYQDSDDDNYGTGVILDGSTLNCTTGSGAPNSDDCDDASAAVHPGATESPGDGLDQDCDGNESCYADDDEDGYADEAGGVVSSSDVDCADPGEGSNATPRTDCDDNDAAIHPDAAEVCNGEDDDCDGSTDDDDADIDIDSAQTWYIDNDSDGYGQSGGSVVSCEQPSGRVATSGDCDDGADSIHPEADELCDGIDNDCDNELDESSAVDAPEWHPDADGDGFGGESDVRACDAPQGWLADGRDCDDNDAEINPDADEYCNDRDDNCDGDVDESSAVDAEDWYADADRDGYGNSDEVVRACTQPGGRVGVAGDCNDLSEFYNPDRSEDPYDGDDSNCDGTSEGRFIRGRTLANCASAGPNAPGLFALVVGALALFRRRRTLGLALAATAVAFPVSAAERYDAHGFNLVPDDGDALDLLSTWRPERQVPYAFGASILGEYSAPTVDLYQFEGDETDRESLRGSFTAINLGGSFAVLPSLALAFSVPIYPANDHAVGDMRLALPLHPVAPAEGESGFGFSIVPYFDVPTGDELNWLGNRGFGGGGTFATGWQGPRWQATANVGGYYQPLIDYENLSGGPHLLAAVGGGALVTDNIAVRGEVNYRPSLMEVQPSDAESPGEAILSARGSYVWGLNWVVGAATAISAGVGASPLRIFIGGGGAIGKEPLADIDHDGITDALDGCKTEPETVNAYKDRDGCPDGLGDLLVKVVDEDTHVVPDATVAAAGTGGISDATGVASLAGIPPGFVNGTVSHPVYESARFDVDPLVEGTNERTVTLRFKTVPVRIVTVDQNGAPVGARVRFEGPTDFGYRFVGDSGNGTFDLRPGNWRLLISTDNGGTERRDIVVEPGRTDPVRVDVAFRPAMAVVDMTRREVVIKEAIYFEVGADTVQTNSLPLVTQVASVLLDHPEILQMEVQGHTDSDGDASRNLELSQRRVEAVCQLLIQQGVRAPRLVPRGYGETVPIASNSAEEGKTLNRRVQFVIIAVDPTAVDPNAAVPDASAPTEVK